MTKSSRSQSLSSPRIPSRGGRRRISGTSTQAKEEGKKEGLSGTLIDWTAGLQPPLLLLRFPHLHPARALCRLRRRHPLTPSWDPWSSRFLVRGTFCFSSTFFHFLLVLFSLSTSSSYVHTMSSSFIRLSRPRMTSVTSAIRAAYE
jgi:hypothetical protein